MMDTFERLRNSLSQEFAVISFHVHFDEEEDLHPQRAERGGFGDRVQMLQEYLRAVKGDKNIHSSPSFLGWYVRIL